MARVFGRSHSTHAWKDHENHWKTITTLTVLGYAWKWGPRASALASTRSSKFGNEANHQIPCSRNLPATPPQQNMVSGMLLVCNRIQQNVWLLMTNICPMTEHRVSFCSISDLFPQRKNLWVFFPRNYPATTVSQIVSWLCPLAIYLPHATIEMNNNHGK